MDLELDPERVPSVDERQRNASHLRFITKLFIDEICNSHENMPKSFRHICNIIQTQVQVRFPEAKFTAVGSFIFLRFFCPAMVAPDAGGLIKTTLTKNVRRSFLLVTK